MNKKKVKKKTKVVKKTAKLKKTSKVYWGINYNVQSIYIKSWLIIMKLSKNISAVITGGASGLGAAVSEILSS